MKAWQENQLEVLLSAQTEQEAFEGIAAIGQRLGFDHCAYGMRMPLPISRPRVVMLNTYPTSWQQRYEKQRYVTVDPTARHAAHSTSQLLWTEELFTGARELWEEARAAGLCYGWCQPCRDATGVPGMLTVARSHEPVTDLELSEKGTPLSWLTEVAHMALTRLIIRHRIPEASVKLSEREREVMRFVAEGKTASEIADILKRSERTVRFHVNSAVRKLNAPNKTAAVVRAAVVGLLY